MLARVEVELWFNALDYEEVFECSEERDKKWAIYPRKMAHFN